MSHIGHPPPEAEPWSCLEALGIDVELAKKAVHKLYFEFVKYTRSIDDFSEHYDVFFIPNDTKNGSLFTIKYGTKINE